MSAFIQCTSKNLMIQRERERLQRARDGPDKEGCCAQCCGPLDLAKLLTEFLIFILIIVRT
jgi:hypothetical protein